MKYVGWNFAIYLYFRTFTKALVNNAYLQNLKRNCKRPWVKYILKYICNTFEKMKRSFCLRNVINRFYEITRDTHCSYKYVYSIKYFVNFAHAILYLIHRGLYPICKVAIQKTLTKCSYYEIHQSRKLGNWCINKMCIWFNCVIKKLLIYWKLIKHYCNPNLIRSWTPKQKMQVREKGKFSPNKYTVIVFNNDPVHPVNLLIDNKWKTGCSFPVQIIQTHQPG